MNVLSLFDGMSCGRIALERAGIRVTNYYASEIKKHAIKVAHANYPDTIQVGDVTKISYKDGILYTENGDFNVGKIDLLIGGSPCQDFSSAKAMDRTKTDEDRYGLEGKKSSLFYEYLRIKEQIKPTHFLLENVKMKDEAKQELDSYLGVEGLYINSSLVSYQRRARYYWTDVPSVTVPDDRGVSFQSFKDTDPEYCRKTKLKPHVASYIKMWAGGNGKNNASGGCANVTDVDKIYCLTTKQDRCPNSGLVAFEDFCRYLTQRELELAQTVPVGYTSCLSYNQAADVLGDGWTVDVIAHIFNGLKKE